LFLLLLLSAVLVITVTAVLFRDLLNLFVVAPRNPPAAPILVLLLDTTKQFKTSPLLLDDTAGDDAHHARITSSSPDDTMSAQASLRTSSNKSAATRAQQQQHHNGAETYTNLIASALLVEARCHSRLLIVLQQAISVLGTAHYDFVVWQSSTQNEDYYIKGLIATNKILNDAFQSQQLKLHLFHRGNEYTALPTTALTYIPVITGIKGY
jgi:hypothetical protein